MKLCHTHKSPVSHTIGAPGKQLPGAATAGLSHSARHRGAGQEFGSTIRYGARWVLAKHPNDSPYALLTTIQIARFRVNSQSSNSSFVRIFFFWIWFDFFDLLTDLGHLARACLSFLEPPSSSCEFGQVRMVRAITQRPCYLDRRFSGPDFKLTSVAVDSGSRRVRRARGRLYETQVRS